MNPYAQALGFDDTTAPTPAVPGSAPGIRIPAAQQAAADADAGFLMVKNEYGGDVNKARADLAQLDSAISQAKGTAKDILASHRARLAAGIQSVGQGSSPAPAADPSPAVDPYSAALGFGNAPAPSAAPAVRPSASTVHKVMTDPITTGAQALAPKAIQMPSAPQSDLGTGVGSVLANQVTGLGANIVGGVRGLATLLTGGGVDQAANDVRDYVEQHTYTGNPGSNERKAVEGFSSPANPLTYIPQAADALGGAVTDATKSPTLGALVNAGVNVVPMLLGVRGKPATASVEVGPSRPAVGAYKPVPIGSNPTGEVFRPPMPQQSTPSAGAAVQPGVVPQQPTQPAQVQPATSTPVPATPEAVQAVAQKAPSALFPETATVAPSGQFAPAEQQARAQVLQEVGLDKARPSAVSGDKTSAATDWQTSKLDSPAGRFLKSQFENERQALSNYSDSLLEGTGGSKGLDEPSRYTRGETILEPLKALDQWYNDKASELYNAADERAQGVPVQLNGFGASLNDPSLITQPSHPLLQNAVKAKATQIGMEVGEDGSISGTAKQAEVLRKFLNQNSKGANGPFASALKESLDNDVMSSAGDDLYTQARQLWSQKKSTLDNPNGISKLLDQDGVNRAVPQEMVPAKLVKMPVDQFGHVLDTLKSVPDEIAPQAQGAINEIKAQFANEINQLGNSQAGQWNAKGVRQYLQNNAAKMAQVFTPAEMAKFQTLNDAGHILRTDQSYPGAAIQQHNIVRAGVMNGLPSAGAAAGQFLTGTPVGAAAGAAAGRFMAGKLSDAAALKAANQRVRPLSELLGVGK